MGGGIECLALVRVMRNVLAIATSLSIVIQQGRRYCILMLWSSSRYVEETDRTDNRRRGFSVRACAHAVESSLALKKLHPLT